MVKSKLIKTLEQLEEKDIYSLLLFVLYKLKDDSKYSTLSELVYILDKDNLFNLLSVFGGLTITIPKIKDLQLIVTGLLIYQLVNLEGKDLTTSIKDVKTGEYTEAELRDVYLKVCEVVSNYEFKRK